MSGPAPAPPPWAVRHVGRLVKIFRTRAGIDRRELARQAGYSTSQVEPMEQGRRTQQPEFLDRAEEILAAHGVLTAVRELLADGSRAVAESAGRAPADRTPTGPQTLAELRAALALASPGEPAAFDARLNGTRVTELPAVVAEYQRLPALRAGPGARAVIAALLTGRGAAEP
ncbi:helix-turn-helix transcriptional regulator [Streptomyces sp. TRM 70361]|uniref:helix-turn-helix domain-containing protein n=1 Tax=Streptomyces sp. TRM 70361 TaxID=3116553 RepID=UPI002E7BC8DA|nr:helix-turn-helix transcriptional regulator [Streptomyces sp. TRM 70361]MEE1941698.1 helix-turn-helix transcriptional regulator [Streptomyces sp. TRM 70361]